MSAKVTKSRAPRAFKAPERNFGELDAHDTAALLTSAADVALVLDSDGVVRDAALGSEELAEARVERWVGKPWIDSATPETRHKIEALLKNSGPRWRQVNHPDPAGGPDIPVLYSAMPFGRNGRFVAVGRDVRPTAALQQRLVDAQQSMEREFSRLRQAETRYRLLFQISTEAVVIVDAETRRVVEANPAAANLLAAGRRLVGRPFPDGFDASGTRVIKDLLSAALARGQAGDARVSLEDDGGEFLVSASHFRQEGGSHFLLRLAPVRPDSRRMSDGRSRLADLVESAPDGFVVTSTDGRILTANRAFADMAQLAGPELAIGEMLDRWIGNTGTDADVMIGKLREHGSVRLYATSLRSEYGSKSDVEISAVSVPGGETPCFGFAIRAVASRLEPRGKSSRELPHSVENLTRLVGRVPLKDLVGETTDAIERLCIEAALELTGDNRASAAEMLGLSRQSLYVKLRRYGLGELEAEAGS